MFSFRCLFLYLFLCSFINSQISIDIEYPRNAVYTYQKELTVPLPIDFTVTLSKQIEASYLRITTSTQFDQEPAHIYFSLKPHPNRNNNYLFSAKASSENVIYINKEFFFGDRFYIGIHYQNSNNFNFTMKMEEVSHIDLHKGKSYSFLGHEENKINVAKILPSEFSSQDTITLYSVGGNTVDDTSFQVMCRQENDQFTLSDVEYLYNGAVISFNVNQCGGINSYFEVNLSTEINMYHTIGIRVSSGVNAVYSGGLTTYGIINEHVSHECFDFQDDSPAGRNYEYELSILTKTKNLQFYAVDNYSLKELPQYTRNITSQSIIMWQTNDDAGKSICFRKADSSIEDAVTFSFQFTDYAPMKSNPSNNEPLLNGIIYTHRLLRDGITYYRPARYDPGRIEVNFNLRALKGNPKMFVHQCTIFPECTYNHTELLSGWAGDRTQILQPQGINGFYSVAVDKQDTESEVSGKQHVLIVMCDTFDDCEYDVSFYDTRESLLLKPDDRFNAFIMPNEREKYKFEIYDSNIQKVYFNLYTLTGDAYIIQEQPEDSLSMEYLYIQNKEIVVITPKMEGALIRTFEFEIGASSNAYYSVYYIPIVSQEQERVINVGSGQMFLETIKFNEEKKKTFRFTNRQVGRRYNFAASFFAFNCEINVKVNNTVLELSDNFIQHVTLASDDEYYKNGTYDYEVSVLAMDQKVTYANEMCMIYVTGEEIIPDSPVIVLSENIPVQLILNEHFRNVSFVYPYPSSASVKNDGAILSMVLEDEVVLKMIVRVEFGSVKTVYVAENTHLQIDDETIKKGCTNYYGGSVCNVRVDIYVENESDLANGIQFEVNMKSKEIVPSFLKKRQLREDFAFVDLPQYYMTDISKGERGNVVVNFNRGSANVYARIVIKNKADDNPDFNNQISLPKKSSTDLLPYNPYTKEITYNETNTDKCEQGCTLIIGVEPCDMYDASMTSNAIVDYSLYVKPTNNYNEGSYPIVDVPVNEYMYGVLDGLAKDGNYHYYSLYIPSDGDSLIIEFYSVSCFVYVNLGKGNIPSLSHHSFEFKTNGSMNVFTITKAELNVSSLKDIVIIIAVGADILDAIKYAQYNIRLRVDKSAELDVTEVSGEQFSICQVESDSYCDFAIPIGDFDVSKDLFVYAYASEPSTLALYYTKLTAEQYRTGNPQAIKSRLPRKGSCIGSSENQFFTNMLEFTQEDLQANQYILVSVHSTAKATITFLNTMQTQLQQTIPNPNTVQLYDIGDKMLTLLVPNNDDYLIKLTSVRGTARITFGDDYDAYYMKGAQDTMSFVRGRSSRALRIKGEPYQDFSFYVTYIYRYNNHNVDPIDYGTSGEIVYPERDFPVYFYSKVVNETQDVIFYTKIKKLTLADGQSIDNYSVEKFDMKGYIVDSAFIADKKRDIATKPSSSAIEGTYQPSIQSGQVTFTSDVIKSSPIASTKYLFIEMNKHVDNTLKYRKIYLEVTSLPMKNSEVVAPIRQYNFGQITKEQVEPSIYNLKIQDENDDKIRLEIAFESYSTDFALNPIAVNESVDYTKNSTNLKMSVTESKGKLIVDIELRSNDKYNNGVVLAIFSKTHNETAENFIFKYQSSSKEFPNYYTNVDYDIDEIDKSTFNIIIDPIKHTDSKTVLEGVYYVTLYKAQDVPDKSRISSISLNNLTPLVQAQARASSSMKKVEIKVSSTNIPLQTCDVVVHAIVGDDNEMFSYKVKVLEETTKWSVVVVSGIVILAVVLIILVILFILRKRSKDNLTEQVSKERFEGGKLLSEDI